MLVDHHSSLVVRELTRRAHAAAGSVCLVRLAACLVVSSVACFLVTVQVLLPTGVGRCGFHSSPLELATFFKTLRQVLRHGRVTLLEQPNHTIMFTVTHSLVRELTRRAHGAATAPCSQRACRGVVAGLLSVTSLSSPRQQWKERRSRRKEKKLTVWIAAVEGVRKGRTCASNCEGSDVRRRDQPPHCGE